MTHGWNTPYTNLVDVEILSLGSGDMEFLVRGSGHQVQ